MQYHIDGPEEGKHHSHKKVQYHIASLRNIVYMITPIAQFTMSSYYALNKNYSTKLMENDKAK
jgi:hypothetical protein